MKMIKKTIAMLIMACVMISSVTVFAAFSTITTTQTATEVKAGETVTIEATFDTLVDAKGMELEFLYDTTAFTVDSDDDTEYNFGTKKNPKYWPNYISDGLKEQHIEECSFISKWPTFSYEIPEGKVKLLATDAESGYIITAEDEAEDMYPYRTVGVVFTAKDGIAPGNYTFTIIAKVSDSSSGVISSTKTVTVTVAGSGPVVDELDPVAAESTLTTADGNTKYTNVAVMPVNFTIDASKGTAKGLAIAVKKGAETVVTKTWDNISLAGEGAVDFVVAIWGITDGATFSAVPSITYGN